MKLKVGTEYNHIVDVMNGVFGWNYKACMKGFYTVNENPKAYAWFPKIKYSDNGIIVSGDKWYGWCNTITDDMEHIYMINYDRPERMIMDKVDPTPHITFIKRKDSKYTYAGVYVRTKLDKKLGWVYDRVAKDINVEDYL